jgi:hypothetical protein
MKFLLLTFAILFSINSFSQENQSLGIDIGENNSIEFECVIADHGGGCNSSMAYLTINDDFMEFNKVNIINRTADGDSIITFQDLRNGERRRFNVEIENPYRSENSLKLLEGNNTIILQLTGIQGHVMEEIEININAIINMEY